MGERLTAVKPILSKKDFENSFQRHEERLVNIKKFHVRKELKSKSTASETQIQSQIIINVNLQIQYIGFNAVANEGASQKEQEKYFMEIIAPSNPPRKTQAEDFETFQKSSINERLKLADLIKNKILYIGMYKIKALKEEFCGDFEIDLLWFLQKGEHVVIQSDFNNLKASSESTKKGKIKFILKIQREDVNSGKGEKNELAEILSKIEMGKEGTQRCKFRINKYIDHEKKTQDNSHQQHDETQQHKEQDQQLRKEPNHQLTQQEGSPHHQVNSPPQQQQRQRENPSGVQKDSEGKGIEHGEIDKGGEEHINSKVSNDEKKEKEEVVENENDGDV